MPSPDPPPRLAPLEPDQFSDEVNAMFGRWVGGGLTLQNAVSNPVLQTFAHHPLLADLFSPFNAHLLTTTTLPVRERQIAIMRTAWLCNARYMWSSHLRTSLSAGLESDLFKPIQNGADDAYFTDFERVVIRATEDFLNNKRVSDANWAALSEHWNAQQMLDFLFTVGAYVLIAGAMNSLGVQRQDDLRELAETYGAPEIPTG